MRLCDAGPTAAPLASIGQLRRQAARRLAAAGVPDAACDADWLLAAALGTERGRLQMDAAVAVPAPMATRFEDWLARRCRREPLQYILGSQPFRDLDLIVDRRTLIPRPETERVVDLCLETHAGGPIIDVGTGSGAIAIALAVERPGARVVATDVSLSALALARENAARAGVRVGFVCGDLLDPVAPLVRRSGLVVCNPPYVARGDFATLAPEVRDWEPRGALDGGLDGLDYYRRLGPTAARLLGPGAWIVLEIGAGQRAPIEDLFGATGAFDAVVCVRDHAEIERGLGFRRRGSRDPSAGSGRRAKSAAVAATEDAGDAQALSPKGAR
jgi:release factor glutamine methyltransferase